MRDNKPVLAVIPARAGSKRCPRKNVLPFRGLPLVQWAWVAAKGAKLKTVVSTDDGEVWALMAQQCDVVRRPAELATDTATNEDVMRHVAGLYPDYEWLVLLQPTSPLRNSGDILSTIEAAQMGPFPAACTYSDSGRKNGAVYVCRREWLLAGKDFTWHFAAAVFMDEARSLDIDYQEDFNG